MAKESVVHFMLNPDTATKIMNRALALAGSNQRVWNKMFLTIAEKQCGLKLEDIKTMDIYVDHKKEQIIFTFHTSDGETHQGKYCWVSKPSGKPTKHISGAGYKDSSISFYKGT